MIKKPLFAIAMAGLFLLSGCETVKDVASRPETKGAGVGTVLGAGAGAALGSLGGKAGEGAAIGAGMGAVIGGVLGHSLGKQREELKRVEAKTEEVRVIEQPQTQSLVIRVKDQLLFDTGSAVVKPGGVSALSEIAEILAKYPDTIVKINGHTDSTGSATVNQRLSEQRAQAVADILAAHGIPRSRMIVQGFGSTQPIASNSTPEGRALNRRVDIVVQPKENASPQQ
jgi:outer membrane protein OmpA-like peptidoglycan-associated protein